VYQYFSVAVNKGLNLPAVSSSSSQSDDEGALYGQTQ